jgi:hypothetical protein
MRQVTHASNSCFCAFPHLAFKDAWGGVFLKLLDARVFNAIAVNPEFGCVERPGGVDLCLDAMYQANTLAQAGDRANSLHQQPGNCSRLTCRPVPCAAAG